MMPQGHPTHCGCEPFEKPSALKTTNVRYATSTRPAEADGVEVVAWANPADLVQDGHSHSFGVSSEQYEGRIPLMTVAQHQRILSAVTAERDALAAENKLLRGPEQTVVVCEKGKPFTFMSKDPCRYRLCEVTYAAPVRVLIEERDQLRAEVEALRPNAERYLWLRDKSESLHSFYLSTPLWMTGVRFRPENVDSTIDAARAAKEDEE